MNQQKLKLPRIQESKSAAYNFSGLNAIVDKKEGIMIKEAVKNGYLVCPTQDFIWSKFKTQIDFNEKHLHAKPTKKQKKLRIPPDEEQPEVSFDDLKQIELLNLSNVRIIETGDINLCVNIKILILSSNHLISIEPLVSCVNLFRLDLQNNQVNFNN